MSLYFGRHTLPRYGIYGIILVYIKCQRGKRERKIKRERKKENEKEERRERERGIIILIRLGRYAQNYVPQ